MTLKETGKPPKNSGSSISKEVFPLRSSMVNLFWDIRKAPTIELFDDDQIDV
jgi:hypothetical protein